MPAKDVAADQLAKSGHGFTTPVNAQPNKMGVVKQRAQSTAGKAARGARGARDRLRGPAHVKLKGGSSAKPGASPSVAERLRRISHGRSGLRERRLSGEGPDADGSGDGNAKGDDPSSLRGAAPFDARKRFVELLMFASFLFVYTWGSMMGRNNEQLFLFKEQLHGDVCKRIVAEDARYLSLEEKITSIPDFQHWLGTDFYESLYSSRAPSEARMGFVHGQTVTIGSVRASQLRAQDYDCIASNADLVEVDTEGESSAKVKQQRDGNTYLLNNDTQWRCFYPLNEGKEDLLPFGQECSISLTQFTTNTNASMAGRTCARECGGTRIFTASEPLPPTGLLCIGKDGKYDEWWDGESFHCPAAAAAAAATAAAAGIEVKDVPTEYDPVSRTCPDASSPMKNYGFVPRKLSDTEKLSGSGIGPLGSSLSASPHYVHLSPRDDRKFRSTINTLYDAKWIDLKTRAITLVRPSCA